VFSLFICIGALILTSGISAPRGAGQRVDPAAVRASNNRFAGIWKLIGQETRDAKDQIVPPGPNANNAGRLGYIVYDPAGYIAVTIASPERNGRSLLASNRRRKKRAAMVKGAKIRSGSCRSPILM